MRSLNSVDLTFHALDIASVYMHDEWVREAGHRKVGVFTWLSQRASKVWTEGKTLASIRPGQAIKEEDGRVYVFDNGTDDDLPLLVTIFTKAIYDKKIQESQVSE